MANKRFVYERQGLATIQSVFNHSTPPDGGLH